MHRIFLRTHHHDVVLPSRGERRRETHERRTKTQKKAKGNAGMEAMGGRRTRRAGDGKEPGDIPTADRLHLAPPDKANGRRWVGILVWSVLPGRGGGGGGQEATAGTGRSMHEGKRLRVGLTQSAVTSFGFVLRSALGPNITTRCDAWTSTGPFVTVRCQCKGIGRFDPARIGVWASRPAGSPTSHRVSRTSRRNHRRRRPDCSGGRGFGRADLSASSRDDRSYTHKGSPQEYLDRGARGGFDLITLSRTKSGGPRRTPPVMVPTSTDTAVVQNSLMFVRRGSESKRCRSIARCLITALRD